MAHCDKYTQQIEAYKLGLKSVCQSWDTSKVESTRHEMSAELATQFDMGRARALSEYAICCKGNKS